MDKAQTGNFVVTLVSASGNTVLHSNNGEGRGSGFAESKEERRWIVEQIEEVVRRRSERREDGAS
jgi:hypothetical protein